MSKLDDRVVADSYPEEQKYLDSTLDIISAQIKKQEKSCEKGLDYVRELSKYHWQSYSEMDKIEKASTRYDINLCASITNEELDRLRKLRKAYENPYFGKICLDFDGDKEEVYVGIVQIMDEMNLVVTDWRSPIASLFYNSRLGDTSYKAPMGMISCNLEQRKQIKVENGKVDRIIDSDIFINDDELQSVLNQSSSGRMRNIVTTIQEEQNEVIRNFKDKKIVVQGCAGSGKTSVALHRLAYLLYSDKKSTSDNMLIFSPSDTFSSYISNVLPELGENNVMQTTFSDFANAFVHSFKKIESFTEFVSKYYENENDKEKNKLNQFKFSDLYIEALDKFIKRITDTYIFKDDFSYGELTVPVDYMNKLVKSVSGSNISLQTRIDLLTDDVLHLYKDKKQVSKDGLRKKIAKDLIKPAFDPRIAYNKFLESDEFIEAYGKKGGKLNINLLEYPDLLGLMYLNFEMMGYPNNDIIHHLVIDEAQDYAPLQVQMISKMFSGASITALGDCNQTINPYHKYDSLEEMAKMFGKSTKYIELNKAYRSSPEIMDYTNKVVNNDKIISVRDSKNLPVVSKEVSKSEIYSTLISDIMKLKENGFNRICIITKSNKEARAIYEALKDSIDGINVLTESALYDERVFVSASYLAKGLEFDAVISYNDLDNPYLEEDKYLYYVACTRAQHDLVVYNEPKILNKRRG